MNTFLVGEVGLEHTNIKIVKVKVLSSQTTVINEANLENKNYNSFLHLLTEFLNGNTSHAKAIIVVPGIVVNNKLNRRVGLPWNTIDGLELAKALQIPFFKIVSKIEAISLYSKFLRTSDVIELNPKYVAYPDKRLLVYIGEEVQTTISVASNPNAQTTLTDQRILPSAGAHTSFCPRNERDFKFQQFLKKELGLKDNQVPSFQHMLSTKGIVNIYCFMSQVSKKEVPSKFNYKLFVSELKKDAEIAIETVAYYMEILGIFLYTMSAAYLPEGGVYLFGGDFCKMMTMLKQNESECLGILLENFLVNGHLKPRMAEFRLAVCSGDAELDFDQVLKHL
jgi:glucokinase